jgi:hypothetical protein
MIPDDELIAKATEENPAILVTLGHRALNRPTLRGWVTGCVVIPTENFELERRGSVIPPTIIYHKLESVPRHSVMKRTLKYFHVVEALLPKVKV